MNKNNNIWLPVDKPNGPTLGLEGLGLAALLSTGCIQVAPGAHQAQAQQVHSIHVPVRATTTSLPLGPSSASGRTRADKTAPKVYLELKDNHVLVNLTDNAGSGILDRGSNQDYAGSALTSGLQSYEVDLCGRVLPGISTINVPLGTEELSLDVHYSPKEGKNVGRCPVQVTARDQVGNSATETANLYIFKDKVIDAGETFTAPSIGSGVVVTLSAEVRNAKLNLSGLAGSPAGVVSLVLEENQGGSYQVVKSKEFETYSASEGISHLDGYEQPNRNAIYRVKVKTADGQSASQLIECTGKKADWRGRNATYDAKCEFL